MPLPWHLAVYGIMATYYRLHNPETFAIVLVSFELLEKDDVFARQEIGRGQKVVLIGLIFIVLLVERPFKLFKILVEHVFSA